MPTVIKCQKCGANILPDQNSMIAKCPHCGTVYRDSRSAQELKDSLENAEMRMQRGDFDGALSDYQHAAGYYPDDYRGWYGSVKAKTKLFTDYLTLGDTDYEMARGCAEKAMKTAPDAVRKDIEKEWREYCLFRDKLLAKEEVQRKLDEKEKQRKYREVERSIRRKEASDKAKHASVVFKEHLMGVGSFLFGAASIALYVFFLVKKSAGFAVFSAIAMLVACVLYSIPRPETGGVYNSTRKERLPKAIFAFLGFMALYAAIFFVLKIFVWK